MGMFADLPDLTKERKPSGGMFADLPDIGEKPIGFTEAAIQDPLEKIPFGPWGAAKAGALLRATQRLTTGDYEREATERQQLSGAFGGYSLMKTPTAKTMQAEDITFLTKHFEEMTERERRGYTLMGRVGQITSQMPAFMIEFLATGGIARLGSKAAQEVGEKILKESAKKGLGKAVVGISKFAASAGARAAAMPHRGAEAILKRQLPKGITINNLGEAEIIKPDEKVWTSIWKGALDHYIEIASEQAGEFMGPVINKIVGKLPFMGKAIGAMQRAWLRLNPAKGASDFTKKMLSKAGFHGIITEIGEEDLGWIARAVFNIENYGAGPDASMGERLKAGLAQDIQNLPAELIAFAIPGLAGKGVAQLFPEEPMPTEPVSIEPAPITDPTLVPLGKTIDKAAIPQEYQVIEYDRSGMEVGPVEETFTTKEEAQAYADTMTQSSFTPGTFEVRMAAKPVEEPIVPREVEDELTEHEQTLGELADTLVKRGTKIETPIEKLNRGGVYKIIHGMKSLSSNVYQNLVRIERLLEGLDGHKEGAFTKNIWKPMKEADEFGTEATNNGIQEFVSHLEEQGIDVTLWLGQVDEVGPGKIRLTASQRVGIYTLSKNKNGMRYLVEGMGFSLDNIKSVLDFMSDSEKTQGDWLLEQYEAQWPVLKTAAIQAGIDPKILKKEFRYSPILRTDADLEQQTDFLSGLADQYTRDSFSPEKRMLEQRKPGARGEIELDAFVMYMHNIVRTERFKAMASTTAKVGKILNDKNLKRQINAATYGHGSKVLSTWLRDTVRGTSTGANTLFQKAVTIARRNGVVYAIGYNLPSTMRQTLSMNNAVAVDKLMLKYIPINMTKAMTPKGYAALEQFVYNRSLLVKTRSFERDLRQKWNKSSLKKKLKGKVSWSQTATSWIRWMDKHTVVVAWKSLYDTGMEKFNGNEDKAKEFADKWIGRTQPMANTKDLPQFFRGGSLEKLLTTFQNQINQNGNFYLYDIIGAKRAGEISWKMVGYRTMFSYVLPAMLFGMIGRARPPKTWKDVMIDLSTYPIAPLLLVGRWVDRMIRGWGQSGTIAEVGPEAAIRTVEAAKRGDLRGFMFGAAKTVGAFTGTITAQMVRTVEGALDLLAGSTQDPRRLVYSKWALEQGRQKEVKRGKRRRTRRHKPTRRTRRRR